MEDSLSEKNVHLIVSDIEGCLSDGKGLPLDLVSLQWLQAHNQRAERGEAIPLTLCTGRSQPFVEAFCQILSVYLPCVCENGAFLYDPVKDVSLRHPAITARHVEARRELLRVLETEIVQRYPHRREPGKEICISLNPAVPKERYAEEIPALFVQIGKLVDPALFNVTHSASAVDITPAGIGKAAGVRYLAEVTGIPLQQMAGIGDTVGDLPFLRIVGYAAAPSNCSHELRDMARYVSKETATRGVVDIVTGLGGA